MKTQSPRKVFSPLTVLGLVAGLGVSAAPPVLGAPVLTFDPNSGGSYWVPGW